MSLIAENTYILQPVEYTGVFFLTREAGCPVLMLQWFFPLKCDHNFDFIYYY